MEQGLRPNTAHCFGPESFLQMTEALLIHDVKYTVF